MKFLYSAYSFSLPPFSDSSLYTEDAPSITFRDKRSGRDALRISRLRLFRLHEEITHHLQVKRRAEFGAVERVDARLVRGELHSAAFTGLEAQVHVVAVDCEPVCRVPRALHVREMHDDLVAFLNRYMLRVEVAPYYGHPYLHGIPVAHDPFVAYGCRLGVDAHGHRIESDFRVNDPRFQLVSLYHLHVVRLAHSYGHVVEELHILPANVY